jgi:hypothetical protein
MARRRTGQKLLRTLLPLALLALVALGGLTVWITRAAMRPPHRNFLITPQKLGQFSPNAFNITDETWTNRDGTTAHGWLLRGSERAPAVILVHNYDGERSQLLNLGVKLNEATRFTVLWMDLRGHGEMAEDASSFGAAESADVASAAAFLNNLKNAQGQPFIGDSIGIYGVELGGYAALVAAGERLSAPNRANTPSIRVRALALDSVPSNTDAMLRRAIFLRTGLMSDFMFDLARFGTRVYFLRSYQDMSACDAAARVRDARVLLLSGGEAGDLRTSTQKLAQCFPSNTNVETQLDLPITALSPTATGEQGERYDRRIIEFFDRALNPNREVVVGQ